MFLNELGEPELTVCINVFRCCDGGCTSLCVKPQIAAVDIPAEVNKQLIASGFIENGQTFHIMGLVLLPIRR